MSLVLVSSTKFLFRSSYFFSSCQNAYKLILFLCQNLFSIACLWIFFSWEQHSISYSFLAVPSEIGYILETDIPVLGRSVRCAQSVIVISTPSPNHWAYTASNGFKETENLCRIGSVSVWEHQNCHLQQVFVVWGKKQLRRNIKSHDFFCNPHTEESCRLRRVLVAVGAGYREWFCGKQAGGTGWAEMLVLFRTEVCSVVRDAVCAPGTKNLRPKPPSECYFFSSHSRLSVGQSSVRIAHLFIK